MLEDTASCSDKIEVRINKGEGLEFYLVKDGVKTGIKFRMVPNGHEFSTLLLAILNSDGKGKNFPDELIRSRVKALKEEIHISFYISLTCTNCPDVVQSLNLMTVINPSIRHEVVDGVINQEETDRLKIQVVPAVYADGEFIHSGRAGFGELLDKLEEKYGSTGSGNTEVIRKEYDVLIIGGALPVLRLLFILPVKALRLPYWQIE